ncbi:Alpha-L-fucosidase [Lachnellula subtilissima]|uniref:Alpha-L-fucosidase n=1 Tax=Lachnellula subtilissima TaxID=602034 RepID=A0A8H8S3K8_9HELO|nr:Alpha-L-fucosidase [Lachnellula subtilissima]
MTEALRPWYKAPASKWPDALPIGNGRLGAMIYSEIQQERWQLNEDLAWYGCATDRNPKDPLKHLPKLRRLLNEGLLKQAEDLAGKAFIGMPESQRHYEPLDQINITFLHLKDQVTKYRRHSDLNYAIAGVSYEIDGVCHRRESLSSNPDGVTAAKFSASHPGMVSFDMGLFRGLDTNVYMNSIRVVGTTLIMKGQTEGNGVHFCLVATVVIEGGSIESIGETIVVSNANKASIIIAAETTFCHNDPEATCLQLVEKAIQMGYDQLRTCHVKDHQSLFSRVDLRLGSDESQNLTTPQSTSSRLALVKSGTLDLGLVVLYS